MITKCPHCNAMLECEQETGTLVDCVACGKPFEVRIASHGPPSPMIPFVKKPIPHAAQPGVLHDAPWKDDQLVPLLLAFFILAVVLLGVFGNEEIAYLVSAAAGAIAMVWVISLLRACSFRLRHIEELLARR